MGSRKEKKKKKKSRGWLVSMLFPSPRTNTNKASSPTSKRRKRSQDFDPKELLISMNNNKASSSTYTGWKRSLDLKHYYEFEDMRKLSSNDEAFQLPWRKIKKILDIIRSRKTPAPKRYMKWDQYVISFYLKMCTCFGVDYQHLEATSEDDCGNKPILSSTSLEEQEEHMECTQPSTKEMLSGARLEELEHKECTHPSAKEMSYEELIEEAEHMDIDGQIIYLKRPFKMGFYSPGTEPDRIPYHLYLLVKEAVDMRDNNIYDLITVEKKIRFFCTCFRSHLPTGWKYNRDDASFLIAGYDTTRKPRYLVAGYTPFGDWVKAPGFDRKTYLTARNIVNIMSIIHSRKTPTFWGMSWYEMSFYCKLCSCFGIDYHHLEAASEDDVCLMNMGRNG